MEHGYASGSDSDGGAGLNDSDDGEDTDACSDGDWGESDDEEQM